MEHDRAARRVAFRPGRASQRGGIFRGQPLLHAGRSRLSDEGQKQHDAELNHEQAPSDG